MGGKWVGWIGNIAFFGTMAVVFLVPDALNVFVGSFWGAFGFFTLIAVVLAISMLGSLRSTRPEEVLAQNEAFEKTTGLTGKQGIGWVLTGGFLLCIALLAVIAFLIVPGERGDQMGLFLYGSGLIVVGLSLPLWGWAAGWLIGHFIKPVSARGEFMLSLDGDPRAALAARADPHRLAKVADGLSRAEPLNDGTGRHRLYPDGMLARVLGMGQVVEARLASDGSWLEARSLTDKGDTETLTYRVVAAADGGRALACSLETDLRNPLIKLIARILGPDHLIKGGAMVEAKRIGDMLGTKVETEVRRASF
ncbi:MAG: hypothetical protein R3D89_00560 [Sphingomonadaceae bacterium]